MLIILFSAHLILDLNLTLVWDLFGLRKSKTRNVLLFGVNFQWKKISKIWVHLKFLWEQKFYVGTLLFGTSMFLRHVFNMKISAGNEPYYCIWLRKNSKSHFMVYKIEGLQNRNFMISPKWNRFRVIRWYVFIITSIWTYHWSINHVISVTWFISHVIILDPVIISKKTISAQNSEVDTEENGQEAPESTICTVTRADSMGTLAQGTYELYIMTSWIWLISCDESYHNEFRSVVWKWFVHT